MPPQSQFGIQQFDTNRGTTLLGQPSNSRFSQLGSPASTYQRPSGTAKLTQSVLDSRRIYAQRVAQRSAKLASAPKRSGTFTLGSSLSGGGSLGSPSGFGGGGSVGRTVVTPKGPSAGVISGLQGLVGNYNKSFESANKANEERYQQLLGLSDQDIGQQGSQKTFRDMYALAGRRGSAEMTRTDNSFQQMLNLTRANTGQRLADIRSDYGNRAADQQQQLARLGMGNTTVGNAMSQGNTRELQSSLNRASDELSGREIDLLGGRQSALNQLSQADQDRRLGIMERGQSSLSELAQRAQATKMGVIERRTDKGPSSGSIMDIIAGIGSQYGGGTGINAVLQALGKMRT